MKRLPPALLVAVLSLAPALNANTCPYVWTGLGTGWQGQLTPVSADTTYLWFGKAINHTVALPGDFTLGGVLIAGDGDEFSIVPATNVATPIKLTLGTAIALDDSHGRLEIGAGINIAIPSSGGRYISAGNNSFVVSGQIVDSGEATPGFLTLATGQSGAFIFNHAGAGNTYTDNTILGDGTITPTVAFWNSSPFGTGKVYLANGGILIAHNTLTVANDFVVNHAGASNSLVLKSWDAPLTLSGDFSLANNAVITVQNAQRGVAAPDNTGTIPTNGAGARHPIVITGKITDDSLATSRALTVQGPGILVLAPDAGAPNTYSGGTTVNGTLIFGNNDAIPATGNLVVNNGGYVGTAVTTTGYVATLLGNIKANAGNQIMGALGIDTLPGSATTATLLDDLDLTGVGTADQIRIGTATKATIASLNLTPNGTHYRFGNGGGTLTVQTALGDTTLAGTATRSVILDNASAVPLKLFLQGANTYTGGTTASNGILVFDSATALPNYTVPLYSGGQLKASGSATNLGTSYVGYTDAVTGLTPAAFLGYFDKANTWGVIGFDTHGTNATVSIANVDLTGFTDGVFLGTATRATLTGTIKPTTVANTTTVATGTTVNAAPNFVRLTAANGGTLTVNAGLLAANGVNSLELGSRSGVGSFSNGTVVLSPDATSFPSGNTYTGGTYVNGYGPLTLEVGGANPLGPSTSALNFMSGGGSVIGLRTSTSGYTLANPIVFQPATDFYQSRPSLNFTGANAFTLAGNISGDGSIYMVNDTTSPTVTLSGDNSGFTGSFTVLNGTLNLAHNRAAGGTATYNGVTTGAVLDLLGPDATIAFTGAATTPTVTGIRGDGGNLIVPNGTTLTFDTTASESDYDFGGTISAAGGATTNAAFIVTSTRGVNSESDTEFLYLFGENKLSAASTITVDGVAALALGHNNAAGLATIVIDAAVTASGEPRGGIALNDGVVLTNPLTFNTGALAGAGTFAPTALKQNGQTVSTLTIGANQVVFPGIPGDASVPTTLTIGTSSSPLNVAFANGGAFLWTLQDPLRSDGYSLLFINGSLDLSGLTSGGFVLQLETIDFYGNHGYTMLTDGETYVVPFLEATGGITSSLAATGPLDITNLFSIQTADFQHGTMDPSAFHVMLDGNKLSLSFTAVPEPGTYALFGAGLLALALAARRRRT